MSPGIVKSTENFITSIATHVKIIHNIFRVLLIIRFISLWMPLKMLSQIIFRGECFLTNITNDDISFASSWMGCMLFHVCLEHTDSRINFAALVASANFNNWFLFQLFCCDLWKKEWYSLELFRLQMTIEMFYNFRSIYQFNIATLYVAQWIIVESCIVKSCII